ncbi:MAG: tRNA-dihydrouridine synthase [bacterium]
MQTFWDKLPKPFFVLAPLANVTDAAFRRMVAKYGKPDVLWTEFVSADGLCLASAEGKAKLMRDLDFTETERPIVAQFFTSNPERMEQVARLARELGFDGVDINMGCPDKTIEKQGAGAKLITHPALAAELIRAAKRGAGSDSGGIPVSVKTRLGYNKDVLDEWLPVILAEEPAAVTIHARTRKEMSKVAAHWERVARAVEIRDELQKDSDKKTLIIGNGDVKTVAEAKLQAEESDADGVMIGRGIFGAPWLFGPEHSLSLPPLDVRLRIAVEHAYLFEELLGDIKNFALMKKHFRVYVEGFPGARELRTSLMETNTAAEVEKLIEEFLQTGVY